MFLLSTHQKKRSGGIIPLFAILMIPLIGMVAFAVDVGYMTLVRTELQNAADSAALSGAEVLQNLYVQYNLPKQDQQWKILATATTNVANGPMDTAKRFSSYNKAGNVNVLVLDSDITFGFVDTQGTYTSPPPFNVFPNTISVTTRRDGSANGSLPLFFGGVLGKRAIDMVATARATIFAGDVSSLRVIPGVNAHILPVALDQQAWQSFYQTGLSPDGLKYTASDGYPQLQVYPSPSNAPGNFGLLDVGPPANDAPAFRSWISSGETPNDISYLLEPARNMLPISIGSPKNWKAGPGLKSTLLSNFQADIGQPNLIPLFVPVSRSPYVAASGSGQNATYAIVGFVGVTLSEASGNGSHMNISIQPMAVIDPTAVILNPTPAGTSKSSFETTTTTFIAAKLTQ